MKKNKERNSISLDKAINYLSSCKPEDIVQRALSKRVLKEAIGVSILPIGLLTLLAPGIGLFTALPLFYFSYKRVCRTYANRLKFLADNEEEYGRFKDARTYAVEGYQDWWYVEDEVIKALRALKKYQQKYPLNDIDTLNIFSLYYRVRK